MKNIIRRRFLLCSPIAVVVAAVIMCFFTTGYLRSIIVFSSLVILIFMDRYMPFSEQMGDAVWERRLVQVESFILIGALSLLAASFFSLLIYFLFPSSRENWALSWILFLFLLPIFIVFLKYAIDTEHEKRKIIDKTKKKPYKKSWAVRDEKG